MTTARGTATPRPTVVRWRAFGTLVAALSAWTLLIIAMPQFRFDVEWPSARAPLETTGALVVGLAAALSSVWFSFTRSRSTLLFTAAFAILGANQLVFGVIVRPPQLDLAGHEQIYFWTAGRFLAGTLLLVALRRRSLATVDRLRPNVALAASLVVALGVLALSDTLLWDNRASLPVLSSGMSNPAQVTGPLPGLTPADIVIGAVGTALFLFAASLLGRRRAFVSYPHGIWLAAALVLAAFTNLHYMLFPTVFTDRISTGDILRVAYHAVLFFGLLWEVRLAYAAQHSRSIELEELARMRAEVSGTITHDVLHSIGTLRNFAVHLSRSWESLGDTSRFQIAGWIERETARLRDLVDRSVSVMDIDVGVFPLFVERERTADIVQEVIDAVADLKERLVVDMRDDVEDVWLDVDRTRILQVFRNVFGNAEKYSPRDRPIDLVVERDGDDVVFSVRDHGPGIPPADRSRLFQRFSRTEGSRGVSGWGLGLYISRTIVEAHSGRIWAESTPGHGATFSFAIPAAPRTNA